MSLLELASCIPYALGHPRILGVKGISRNWEKNRNVCERNFKEDFPKNFLGELSNSSSRRQTHDCFEEISSNSPRRVVQCIYRNSVVSFREQKAFVLKTGYFYSHAA